MSNTPKIPPRGGLILPAGAVRPPAAPEAAAGWAEELAAKMALSVAVTAVVVDMLKETLVRARLMGTGIAPPDDAVAITSGAIGAAITFWIDHHPHPEEITTQDIIQALFPFVRDYADQALASAADRRAAQEKADG
jgi:hypothetical protein